MNDRLLGMLGLAVRAGKVRFGAFMTERTVSENKAELVIIAEDCGASNARKTEAVCKNASVRRIVYGSKEDISRAVGKKNLPMVCVCDKSFADAIVKIYGGVVK